MLEALLIFGPYLVVKVAFDMADITTRIPDCDDDCEGERGERGKRGHRGHRGHDGRDGRDGDRGSTGPAGLTGPTGPAEDELPSPPFASPPVINTIFARLTGSDVTGDGTLVNPYRSFQRAIRDVPHVIPPGVRFVVDVTGLGTEVLPAGYQFPVIKSDFLSIGVGPLPFQFETAFNVRAFPQPASNIPVADTTVPAAGIVSIAADPATGLAIITVAVARASWAADSLKGKFLTGTSSGAVTSVIHGSNATQLFVANTPSNIPVQALSIVEPSANLEATDTIWLGDLTTVALQGLAITTQAVPVAVIAIEIAKTAQPITELCDIEGLAAVSIGLQFLAQSTVIRDHALAIQGANFTPRRGLFMSLPSFVPLGGSFQALRQMVMEAVGGIGDGPIFTAQGGIGTNWSFLNCLVRGNTNAAVALFARGAGSWSLQDVEISAGLGDAIRAQGLTQVVLNHVTGLGNTGIGVQALDGASVRVIDDATLVTGAGGDIKAGTLITRTWADFRALAPIKNEYDLSTPFVVAITSGVSQPPGDELTGVGTGGRSGSRIFQRP